MKAHKWHVVVVFTVLLLVAVQPAPQLAGAVPLNHKLSGTMPSFGDVEASLAIALSVDGRYVVYVADQDTDDAKELWSAPADASAPPVRLSGLLPAGTTIQSFLIAPNSERVVYKAAQDTAGLAELYSVPIGGGTPVKLNGTLIPGRSVFEYEIAPDSSRVVYVAEQDVRFRKDVYSVDL
ncbi:MAG TPA: hypothetical protein VFT99_13360, partial [Roseiflexaceae bacterium]|nr:hypothetical protein [Roseiflexaceae bacterium]